MNYHGMGQRQEWNVRKRLENAQRKPQKRDKAFFTVHVTIPYVFKSVSKIEDPVTQQRCYFQNVKRTDLN